MIFNSYRCKIVESKSDDINPENNFQAHSMSQLAAYKKHYYDTLLSVQRAKGLHHQNHILILYILFSKPYS